MHYPTHIFFFIGHQNTKILEEKNKLFPWMMYIYGRKVRPVHFHQNKTFGLLKIPQRCLKFETTIFKWQLYSQFIFVGQKKISLHLFPSETGWDYFCLHSKVEKKVSEFLLNTFIHVILTL